MVPEAFACHRVTVVTLNGKLVTTRRRTAYGHGPSLPSRETMVSNGSNFAPNIGNKTAVRDRVRQVYREIQQSREMQPVGGHRSRFGASHDF
jgi:hypothetical protein